MKNEAETQAVFAVSYVRNVRDRAMLPDSTVYSLCRVKVSEACFDSSVHDLLHTSTSCHFKICLKSHTVTLLGKRLDESLLQRF